MLIHTGGGERHFCTNSIPFLQKALVR
jgi:hypothetical protein